MKKVAVIGIQGVPANYGGFESLIENMIGENGAPDIRCTVFCSSKDIPRKLSEYKNADLKYIPLRANGVQSVLYDTLSLVRALRGYHAILVLGISGCLFLPVFRLLCKKKLIVNLDGVEHRRQKWGRWARRLLRWSEAMAVRYADIVVADNKGIQDYVSQTYRKKSTLIAYGGDHVLRDVAESEYAKILGRYGLRPRAYHISICRIEPENNCHVTLDAFARSGEELAFVGNWNKSDYGKRLREQYGGMANIHILDAIYDLDTLYILRRHARCYIHGHSAGGTNPSLVEAMFFGIPVFSFDVVYNRETTENHAFYYKTREELSLLIEMTDSEIFAATGSKMKEIAQRRYTWGEIAKRYGVILR